MKDQDKKSYVKYRIEKAEESFAAGELLFENDFWSQTLTRLYYATFYAINALLLAHNISAKTHAGIKNQFSFFFIKERKLDKKFGELFSKLYDWRHQSDYADFFEIDKKDVEKLIPEVKELISVIKQELKL